MFEEFFHLVRQWYAMPEGPVPLHVPRFAELDRQYVMDAIDSTFVSSVGEYVNRFEQNLASILGCRYVVATVNGTAALQVALQLAGVRRKEDVITQSLSFVATANAIVYNGADPVFLDVDQETLGLSPDAVRMFLENHTERKNGQTFNQRTGRRIAAIVPMHTFGHPVQIHELMNIADEWNIPLIEDAAEAIGSSFEGRACGTFGKLGVFSFNGNKTITCGGGGAIVTDDEELAKLAKHLTTTAKVSHHWEFVHDMVGYNYRMPNLNAALACAQMEQLDGFLASKRELANHYANFFRGVEWAEFVTEPDCCCSNYWLNAILLEDRRQRDALLQASNDAGIVTRPCWTPLNELEMYRYCTTDSLLQTRNFVDRLVNIPSSAQWTEL